VVPCQYHYCWFLLVASLREYKEKWFEPVMNLKVQTLQSFSKLKTEFVHHKFITKNNTFCDHYDFIFFDVRVKKINLVL